MAYRGRHHATSHPLVKISLWVGRDDWAWLQSLHRHDASAMLRRLIQDYRWRIEERDAQRGQALDLSQL